MSVCMCACVRACVHACMSAIYNIMKYIGVDVSMLDILYVFV